MHILQIRGEACVLVKILGVGNDHDFRIDFAKSRTKRFIDLRPHAIAPLQPERKKRTFLRWNLKLVGSDAENPFRASARQIVLSHSRETLSGTTRNGTSSRPSQKRTRYCPARCRPADIRARCALPGPARIAAPRRLGKARAGRKRAPDFLWDRVATTRDVHGRLDHSETPAFDRKLRRKYREARDSQPRDTPPSPA